MADPFDHYSFKDVEFGQHAGRDRYMSDLVSAFPGSAIALKDYFGDLDRARAYGLMGVAGRVLPWGLSWIPKIGEWLLRRYRGRTLKDCLDAHISDPRLAAVLCGQCGDHGLPPARASLLVHAIIVSHYMEGGFYPVGGPSRIATEVSKTVSAHGGEVRTSREVTEIIVENGRACGVKLRRTGSQDVPTTVRCENVISAAGARQTWLNLVPESVPVPFREELRGIEAGTAMVTAYLGLNRSPEALGLKGGNRWIFDTMNLDEVAERHARLPDEPAIAAFLSFPSLKDPALQGGHTAQILAPVPHEMFARWEDTRFRRRGADYEALKARLVDRLLDLVESRHPGFRETVAYSELSTPLTVTHFSRHHHGEVYGMPGLPDRYQRRWLGPRTHIKGLYLAGADVAAHGMVGAMSGGLVSALACEGLPGVIAVFRALRAQPRPPGAGPTLAPTS
jgi:all-trans-retinol 13,14-reductase